MEDYLCGSKGALIEDVPSASWSSSCWSSRSLPRTSTCRHRGP